MTKTKFTSPTGGVEYIDTPSLRTRYGGKSEMWVWRHLANDPEFPKPIKIGNRNFWRLRDLLAYEEKKHAAA